MGYPMALNLRKGLDSSYTLLVCDVVPEALSRFQKDAEGMGLVEVVQNGYEAAQRAVRPKPQYLLTTNRPK
jgi:3-hydroxyisobutyrate dehydrogenase